MGGPIVMQLGRTLRFGSADDDEPRFCELAVALRVKKPGHIGEFCAYGAEAVADHSKNSHMRAGTRLEHVFDDDGAIAWGQRTVDALAMDTEEDDAENPAPLHSFWGEKEVLIA